jgi:rhodanese-related sulfurtransferase
MDELNVLAYKAMRDNGDEHLLLDVREANELTICAIDGHLHIPMNDVPARLDEIADWKNKTVVCQCRSGKRSQNVQAFLLKNGFTKVYNLTGGILAWGEQVDNSITPY